MEQASQMVAKAKALTEAVMDRPGSSGNEGGPSEDVSENEGDTSLRMMASKASLERNDAIKDNASDITHIGLESDLSQYHLASDDGAGPVSRDTTEQPPNNTKPASLL